MIAKTVFGIVHIASTVKYTTNPNLATVSVVRTSYALVTASINYPLGFVFLCALSSLQKNKLKFSPPTSPHTQNGKKKTPPTPPNNNNKNPNKQKKQKTNKQIYRKCT
jgi:hypothetical protein